MADDLRERFAYYAHDAWSRWMKYLFSMCSIDRYSCEATIPRESVMRWQRQMNTPYAELSEVEKESDRHQADIILDLIYVSGAIVLDDGQRQILELFELVEATGISVSLSPFRGEMQVVIGGQGHTVLDAIEKLRSLIGDIDGE